MKFKGRGQGLFDYSFNPEVFKNFVGWGGGGGLFDYI